MLNNFTFFQNITSHFWLKFTICLVFSYILSSLSIKIFLKIVNNKSICRQPIRKDGPQTHIIAKKNTPTFGGIFIVLATIIATLFFIECRKSFYIWPVILVFTTFAVIGFIDDFLKVFYKNSKGFRGSIKLIIQFLIIGATYVWLGQIDAIHNNARVFLPIRNGISIGVGVFIYIIFVNFVIVGTANAVNLTDGLDGLVSMPAIINLICLALLIYFASNHNFAVQFHIPYIKNAAELRLFCAALIGPILGF